MSDTKQEPDCIIPKLSDRCAALTEQGLTALHNGDYDGALSKLEIAARLGQYSDIDLLERLEMIYQRRHDLNAIKALWRRAATTAHEQDDDDFFFDALRRSVHATLFRAPSKVEICEDINALIRIHARHHELNQKLQFESKRTTGKRIGIALPGLSGFDRTAYRTLATHADTDRSIVFLSPFAAEEDREGADAARKFANELGSGRCSVVLPLHPLRPGERIRYLIRHIRELELDALIFHTTYAVPEWNFISVLKLVPVQFSLQADGPEGSQSIDTALATPLESLHTHTNTLARERARLFTATELSDPSEAVREFFALVDEAAIAHLGVELQTTAEEAALPSTSTLESKTSLEDVELPPESLIEAAMNHLAKNEATEALTLLERALSIRPDFHNLHFARAKAHHQLGNSEKAKEALSLLLKLEPQHAGGLSLKERLEVISEPAFETEKPFSPFRSAPPRTPKEAPLPDNVQSLIDRALSALKEKEVATALQFVNEAKQKDPEARDLHYVRGLCYVGMDQHRDAVSALEQELAFHPRNEHARRLLDELLEIVE